MKRINVFRNIAATGDSVAWGKEVSSNNATNIANSLYSNAHALAFGAILIACSLAVGCSSDKPQPVSSTNQIPVAQPTVAPAPTAMPVQAAAKPAPKKSTPKKPATVNYTDKTYGVNFEYPRRYAIETGNAAASLVLSNPVPMNFVQPGGVALAAVELPETGFSNTDFSSAFFNVSVNQSLTADQCTEFAVPQPNASETPSSDSSPANSQTATASLSAPSAVDSTSNSKLLLGDLELRATEAVTGEGTRQSDSKYFHVFQNGACYEFALNVTTDASGDGLTKHVDRDKVFTRLEKILATVKFDEVKPDVKPEQANTDEAKTGAIPSEMKAGDATVDPKSNDAKSDEKKSEPVKEDAKSDQSTPAQTPESTTSGAPAAIPSPER